MNGPDDDDSISTWVEDQLVKLSVLAESERVERAERLFDFHDEEAIPEDVALEDAWAWLWENNRPEYHRAMSAAIIVCPDHLTKELLESP